MTMKIIPLMGGVGKGEIPVGTVLSTDPKEDSVTLNKKNRWVRKANNATSVPPNSIPYYRSFDRRNF